MIQPNENSIDTGGLHTIEHLLAKLIRQRIDGLIDCSPFGCRTGFHLIMWGKQDPTEIAKVINVLENTKKTLGYIPMFFKRYGVRRLGLRYLVQG